MQIHDHEIAFGLFGKEAADSGFAHGSGKSASARVVLTDTPTDPRLIVNAPLFKTATLIERPMTWQEAIADAGLDFDVVKRPLTFRNDKNNNVRIPGFYATVRTDTQQPLGIVKDRYAIHQNRDNGDMINILLDDGTAKIVAAGAWAHGALGFVIAKLPADVLIGGEPVQSFIVVTWSHDGTRPTTPAIRMIRPACANTFPVIVFGRSGKATEPRFPMRHVGDTKLKVQAAREALQISFAASQTFAADMTRLLDTPMNQIEAVKLTKVLIPSPKDGDDVPGRTQARRDAITELFARSENLENVRGTAWAYVNAVAEYADHGMVARETKQTSAIENRAISVFDGQADRLKRRSMLLAAEFAA